MTAFAFIHGAGDTGWAWHLVEAELRARGHATVAPDLPSEDASCGLAEYAGAVAEAALPLCDPSDLVVVGHSFGGFTAPLVADRLGAKQLILLAAMIPAPGEPPDEWWSNTGYVKAVRAQAERDGGVTGNDDPMIAFYNGVPEDLAHEAQRRSRGQSETPMGTPWPLKALPDLPTRFLLCRDDHFFPADFFRALVPERLGITPEEIPGGHCVMLGRPSALADTLLDPLR
jgi:pimeloyl-ACP methyl ester carboxylesterase